MMKNQKSRVPSYWYVLCLLGLLNVHCSNNTSKSSSESESSDENNMIVIDYKNAKEVGEPLKLSDICESISYTRLSDSLLIGDVKLVSVHFIQDTFYIDTDNIYTFTKDGKAVRALCTKGQGPEDILKYAMSAFDENKREFTFFNNACYKFSTFTFDGSFVKNESQWVDSITSKNLYARFKNFEIYDVTCANSKSLRSRNTSPLGPYLMYVRDIDTDSIVYTLNNWADDEKATYRGYAEGNELACYEDGENCWFKFCAIDTIFKTSDFMTVRPKFVFETGGKTVDLRTHAHIRVGDIDKVDISAYRIIESFFPLSGNRLLYTVNAGHAKDRMLGLSTADGKTVHYKSALATNDLDDKLKTLKLYEIINGNRFYSRDNALYFLANAVDFFEEGSKPPFEDMDEDSNPVVVKLTLK